MITNKKGEEVPKKERVLGYYRQRNGKRKKKAKNPSLDSGGGWGKKKGKRRKILGNTIHWPVTVRLRK